MKVSIVGPTGYSGRELVRILLHHPEVDDICLFGRRKVFFHQEYPEFTGVFEKEVEDIDPSRIAADADIVFIALPHKVSMEITPGIRAVRPDIRIIDFSADYRLKSCDIYEKFYGAAHKDPDFLGRYTYGLCEAFREEIRKSDSVANPGCYPTGIILPLLPLLEKKLLRGTIISDSKSGASGAGKGLSQSLHFVQCHENFMPYKIFRHQHLPEMQQIISGFDESLKLIFTPHLLPVERGILSVLYVQLDQKVKKSDLESLFLNRFQTEKFVRVLAPGDMPALSHVQRTNFCDIGLFTSEESEYVIIVSAIDNLGKGASGQAVQNMNLMFGFEESAGLL